MNCEQCGKLIGNTLYEIGDKKVCPVCYLGKEGSETKYQQFDGAWTEPILTAFRNPPFKDKPEESKDYTWNQKTGIWTKKDIIT